ncbi:MAG: DUF354 domain-containing protein [Methanosarcinaceae archaeon]|nr:DUF354 domain-containing protein [Methanosarcinaceae archaeon]MDD4748484.1 DUF354 domain-containing protein [Methanosarcinaceae archaeon]
MKVLFNIGHPAQVHLFKNLVWALEKKGHKCKLTTIDKDVSLKLLKAYGFEYELVGVSKPTVFSKALELLKIESKLAGICKAFNPDILVGGPGNAYVAHVGKLIRKPSLIFEDTEHARIEHFLTNPFATVICTPSCFQKEFGKKHFRYEGYHELAYLHPNYFTPDASVLDAIGLRKADPYIILRAVLWKADHDRGQQGIQNKAAFIKQLEKFGRVFLTSEGIPEPRFSKYTLDLPPEKLHDLLYFATLYVGDGGTTASECAVLGTPSVFISTIACGYQFEEEKYGLLYLFQDPLKGEEEGLKKALELLKDPMLKQKAAFKRAKLLKEKIDVTAFMVQIIEKIYFTYSKDNYKKAAGGE